MTTKVLDNTFKDWEIQIKEIPFEAPVACCEMGIAKPKKPNNPQPQPQTPTKDLPKKLKVS